MSYFRTSLWEDAHESLREAALQCDAIRANPRSIKWAVISVHAATQGAMALALNQGNGLLLMSEKDRSRWLDSYSGGKPQRALPFMDKFLNLYDKVCRPDCMSGMVGAGAFASPFGHAENMNQLNEIRNDFVHFRMDGWDIETSGLHSILMAAHELMAFLQTSTLYPWHRANDPERERNAISADMARFAAACSRPFLFDEEDD